MPVLWRQLPAHSAVSPGALWHACTALLRRSPERRQEVAASLCERYGARAAILTDSGTSALRLAMEAVRAAAPGRPIALPAYSCFDLATAADGADVEVVLYDVDPLTLGPETDSLRRAIDCGPSALVAAHLFGYPVDMIALARQCAERGVMLVEDAAQAAGGSLRAELLGSFGSLSVLSFGRGKGTTTGAGGALLARDDAGVRVLERAARGLGTAAQGAKEVAVLVALWVFGRPRSYWLPASIPFLRLGETVYQPPVRPAPMSRASVGVLGAAPGLACHDLPGRRALAARWLAAARHSQLVHVIEPIPSAEPGYLRLPLRLARDRSETVSQLFGRHGLARAYPSPLCSLSPFRSRVRNDDDEFPGARSLAAGLITLPTHRRVAPADLQAIRGWLGSAPGGTA